MSDLVKLLGISWTTRVTADNNIIKAKERTRAKDEAKAKARKAKIEKEAEEEHHLATLVESTIGTLIDHRNPLIKITNLHSHHAMMDYVGIAINLGIHGEIAQNW